jgi:hypothetical protein
MFTVEFERDASVITVLDETGQYDDVEVIIGEDSEVFIRQFDDENNSYDIIIMTYAQLIDILASLNSTEGMHRVLMEGRL